MGVRKPAASRLLCAEPLEGRWLLSAPVSPVVAEADADQDETHSGTLEVFHKSDDEGSDDQGDGAGAGVADSNESDGNDESVASLPDVSTVSAAPVESGTARDEATPPVADGAAGVARRGGEEVEVVELDPADEPNRDVEVDPAFLPATVVAALDARFPGAEVVSADFSDDNGKREFDLRARFDAGMIEATVTPRGTITEIKQAVDPSALPPEVVDWVRSRFPGADIGEAAVVNDAAYELRITPPPGAGAGWDATLSVRDARAADVFAAAVATAGEADAAVVPVAVDEERLLDGEGDRSVGPISVAAHIAATQPSVESSAPESKEPAARHRLGGAEANAVVIEPAGRARAALFAEIAAPLADGVGRIVTRGVAVAAAVPALADSLPVDMAAAERALRGVLDQLDSLAAAVLPDDTSFVGVGLRLVAVAALVAGGHIIVVQLRSPRGGPVVVFGERNTSWGWVVGSGSDSGTRMGTGTGTRRRRRRGGP